MSKSTKNAPYSLAMDSTAPNSAELLPYHQADRAVVGLEKGGRIVGMTKGQFSMIDLIRAVIRRTGAAHLRISTWTAGVRDTKNAAFMVEKGDLLSFQLLCDASFLNRHPAYCAAINELFGKDSIRCTKTHAKIALIENDDWAISIRASMNLNRNPRYEQFDIDDNRDIYNFFAAHFDEMAEDMPAGFVADTAQIRATFIAASRGLNPFEIAREMPAGVPTKSAAFFDWVKLQVKENKRDKRGIRSLRGAAGVVKKTPSDLRKGVDLADMAEIATRLIGG